MLTRITLISIVLSIFSISIYSQGVLTYKIAGTGQTKYYGAMNEISEPQPGQNFYGQDAQNPSHTPSYTNNGDGTITDNVTGLMWSQTPDLTGNGIIDVDDKMTYAEAMASTSSYNLAGYNDWRIPTTKELYSLIMFYGEDPSSYSGTNTDDLVPFLNTDYFDFGYGDTDANERLIDAQFVTQTIYVSTVFSGSAALFGVNLADGRIKGYPYEPSPPSNTAKEYYVFYVRGNTDYGKNNFVNHDDGTITDLATGLMWQQSDNGSGLNWRSALAYAQTKNGENYLGYNDWRLPSIKELQSLIDYTRSPATTNSAAIDPMFSCTQIQDEGGSDNFPFYWSSTTHANMQNGEMGAYMAFGEALGWMKDQTNNYELQDVHGAGAQRSDPKNGDPDDYPYGHGPQGDVRRIFNYVRLVRDSDYEATPPEAEFGANPTSGTEPLIVTFTDNSTGDVTGWSWDFGDGGSSSSQNPEHTYLSGGSYSVSLTVTGPGGSDMVTKQDYISVSYIQPEADFSADPVSGNTPLTVNFSDNSAGTITEWNWNFGDGGTSTLQNPSHVYTSSGTYAVSLAVTGPGGSDTELKQNYITVSYAPPVANFNADNTSGDAPLTVNFTDNSTGEITGWDWNFGDGASSTDQNPQHVYESAGTYTVSLEVTGPGGSNSKIRQNYISVSTPGPVADFAADSTSGTAPFTVSFTDMSTGDIDSWVWQFGDGSASTSQNPVHTYESVGTYAVYLVVSGPGGSDNELKQDYITVSHAAPVAGFEADVTTGDAPCTVNFTDKSTGEITSRDWDFGDGGSSSDKDPVHTYQSAGTYTVTLSVEGPGGSDSMEMIDYITVSDPTSITREPFTPDEFNLAQNYPNPFNPTTNIRFAIPEASQVRLSVFDLLGRELKVLVDETMSPGVYSVSLDASDIPSGTYIYRIAADNFTQSRKMILIK